MKSLNNAEAKDQPFSPAAVIVTLRNLAATISTLAASFLKKKKKEKLFIYGCILAFSSWGEHGLLIVLFLVLQNMG